MKGFIVTVNSPGALLIAAPTANDAAILVARQIITVRELTASELEAARQTVVELHPKPVAADPDQPPPEVL